MTPSSTRMKFGTNPLLTTVELQWNGLLLERFEVPARESGDFTSRDITVYVQQDQPTVMNIHEGKETVSSRIAPSDVCVIPQGWNGNIDLLEPSKYLSLSISPELLARAIDEHVRPQNIEIILKRGSNDPAMLHIALALHQEAETNGETGKLYADALSVALAARLLHLHSASPFLPRQYNGALPRYKLRRVVDYLEANLARNPSLAELADQVSMSPYHFARLFRESTGLAPHQYLIRRRIERARTLLADPTRSLADVAREVGYESQSNFTAAFRKVTGVTPRTFRSAL